MCGIIGIVSGKPVRDRLLVGLKRLEYRGYDSAGISVIDRVANLLRRRALGKLKALEDLLDEDPIEGTCGIGHTRWATHGAPTTANAHPHQTASVSVVHNGIIENFQSLKTELLDDGVSFESETDTEVIAKLIDRSLSDGLAPHDAFLVTLARLEGAFALGVIFKGDSNLLYAARRGSPLVIGCGDGEMFIGSDAIALSDLTNQLIYLEEGDSAAVTANSVQIFDATGTPVRRATVTETDTLVTVSKGQHRHFMHKEIFEQPQVMTQTLGRYVDPLNQTLKLPEIDLDLSKITSVTIIACGTAFFAGQLATYWFNQLAQIPAIAEIASEFRYRDPVLPEGSLVVFVSQSGETADTLAALRLARERGLRTLAVVNVPTSSIAREADHVLQTFAGPEIGVASTKAFTGQLAVLACFALEVAAKRSALKDGLAPWITELEHIPSLITGVLHGEPAYQQLGDTLAKARDILFVGRGLHYAIAMEGALKLKEISYIHAEGYAAGELKHGPIALIDESVPVIGLAAGGDLLPKTLSNLQEIQARGGRIILLTDAEANFETELTIALPEGGLLSSPIVSAVAVQLIAYYTALAKGTDVDQPRNLAKSVTVE